MLDRNRYRGAMVGLAVGDALGATIEFGPRAPARCPAVTDLVGGGPHGMPIGGWTDDTSMALCLGASLLECGWSPRDQMNRYLRWRSEGYQSHTGHCFDIGITVSGALTRYAATGNPISGPTDPHSAGNGCLMRLAPVPLRYANDPMEAAQRSYDSSATTHGAEECRQASGYFGTLIALAVRRASRTELFEAASGRGKLMPPMPTDLWCTDRMRSVAAGDWFNRPREEIRSSGYVMDTLEAALWAFFRTGRFETGAVLAVNLGGDADTVGAVYGQLAGAHYGYDQIPIGWRKKLVWHDQIREMADQLYIAAVQPMGAVA